MAERQTAFRLVLCMMAAAQLELDCNLQSISASIEAVCRKTPRDVNRDSGGKTCPRQNQYLYMSYETAGWESALPADQRVGVASCVVIKRLETDRRIKVADGVAKKGKRSIGCIVEARDVVLQRSVAGSCVEAAFGVAKESERSHGRVARARCVG
jgi:hypothetical protein